MQCLDNQQCLDTQAVPGYTSSAWIHKQCLDAHAVPGCTYSAWMHMQCLDTQAVPGYTCSAWIHKQCLDAHTVPGYTSSAWMHIQCLDTQAVPGLEPTTELHGIRCAARLIILAAPRPPAGYLYCKTGIFLALPTPAGYLYCMVMNSIVSHTKQCQQKKVISNKTCTRTCGAQWRASTPILHEILRTVYYFPNYGCTLYPY